MTEQTLTPVISREDADASSILEKARHAHERYLIKQQENDLEKAVEYYIDAIKINPTLAESYYRLASLLLIKGQISIEGALEQCKTATSLEPSNPNAHIYTGYFQCLNGDYSEAEKEFSLAISESGINSARPRLFLSKVLLNRIKSKSSSVKDIAKFLYYFLSGSLMLAWDRPSMKMFYKNMSDDFSVFTYNTVGKFLEKFIAKRWILRGMYKMSKHG